MRQFQDRLETVNVDSCGIGHYFITHLQDLGFPVTPVNVATGPVNDSQGLYANRRAKILFGGLRQRFKAGDIYSAVGWDDETIRQLSRLQWRIVPASGKVTIESKMQAKSRCCPSPDIADAIALAMIEAIIRLEWYRKLSISFSSLRRSSSDNWPQCSSHYLNGSLEDYAEHLLSTRD